MLLVCDQFGTEIEYQDHTPDNGGLIMQASNDAARVERTVFVRWDELALAVQGFLGYALVDPFQGVAYISRFTPHSFVLPGAQGQNPYLYATAIPRIEGLGPRGVDQLNGQPTYEKAKLTVVYTSPTYEIVEDSDTLGTSGPLQDLPDEARLERYITKIRKPRNRAITVPRSLLRWVLEAGDPNYAEPPVAGPPILESIGKQEPGLELTYTHHLRPDLPMSKIHAAMGKVNSVEFDGYPAGSLLCDPPEIKPISLPHAAVGTHRAYDVSFKFIFLPKQKGEGYVGHNYFLRYIDSNPAKLDYRLVTSTGFTDGTKVFPTYDFHDLFRPS